MTILDDTKYSHQIVLNAGTDEITKYAQVDRDLVQRRYGYLGHILGFPLTAMAFLGTASYRIIGNTFIAAGNSIDYGVKLAAEEQEAEVEAQELTEAQKREKVVNDRFGVLGYFPIGAVLGGGAYATVMTYRFIGNVAITAFKDMQDAVNYVLNLGQTKEPDAVYAPDIATVEGRKAISNARFGFAGHILGFPLTAMAFLGTASYRIIGNTFIAAGESIEYGVKAAAEEQEADVGAEKPTEAQKREKVVNDRFGVLGYFPIGFVLGGGAYATVMTYRFIGNVAITAFKDMQDAVNYVLNLGKEETAPADNDTIETLKARQDKSNARFGFVGHILGSPLTAMAFLGTASYRIIGNTFIAAGESIEYGVKAAAEEQEADVGTQEPTEAQKREKVVNDRFGVLGYVPIGLVLGGGAYATVMTYRFIGNVAITVWNDMKDAVNYVLNLGKEIVPVIANNEGDELEKRKAASNARFGFAGHILGFPLTAMAFLGTASYRIIGNTFIAAGNSIEYGVKLAAEEQETEVGTQEPTEAQKREKVVNNRFGVLGHVPVGLVLGGGVFLALSAYRSTGYLSRSLMNVGVGHPYFTNTVADDKRSSAAKWVGAIVASPVLALVTGVAATYMIGRVVTPLALFVCAGVLSSPYTVVSKFNKVLRDSRFKTQEINSNNILNPMGSDNSSTSYTSVSTVLIPGQDNETQQKIIQRFKNLFSSVDVFGHFREGEMIKSNGTGGKGAGHFLTKLLTCNIRSSAEYLLHEIYKAYKISDDMALVANGYSAILASAIARDGYGEEPTTLEAFALMTKDEKKDQNELISKMGQFILDYVRGENEEVIIPSFSKEAEQSYQEVFSGVRHAQAFFTPRMATATIVTGDASDNGLLRVNSFS